MTVFVRVGIVNNEFVVVVEEVELLNGDDSPTIPLPKTAFKRISLVDGVPEEDEDGVDEVGGDVDDVVAFVMTEEI